jgi:hypothetical protein
VLIPIEHSEELKHGGKCKARTEPICDVKWSVVSPQAKSRVERGT